MQTFLSVGFSPSAALVTWQLEQSGLFQTFTYWPTHTVDFSTELFGNHRFQPNQLDISTNKAAHEFDFILLCIPSLKDVNRMVKKIDKVVSKSTMVLVNISDGTSLIQRLVKSQLPKTPVAAFICDFPARHVPDTTTNVWRVLQWGNAKSPGPQMACHIEPTATKQLAPLEAALGSRKMPCSHPKNNAAFLAVQWERTIFTVGFELMTILFNTPSVEKVVCDQMARPIIDGVVNELLVLASASGSKTLPSCSNFVQQAPYLTRKAPSIFAIPHASRLYYDFYNRSPISLDLLVLCPIMLADEYKKARTPYLDSLYAFSTQLQALNSSPSDLFARVDLEAKQRQLDREYEQKHGNSNTARLEQQLQHAILQSEQREARAQQLEATAEAREARASEAEARLAELEARVKEGEAALDARQRELRAREEHFAKQREADRLRRQQQALAAQQAAQQAQAHPGAAGAAGAPAPAINRTQSSSKLPTMPNMPGTPRQPVNENAMAAPAPQGRPKPGRPLGPPSRPPPANSARRASQHAGPPPNQLDMISLTQSKNKRNSLRNTRAASMASMPANNGSTYSQSFHLDDIMGLASQDRYSLAVNKRSSHGQGYHPGLSSDHTLGANRPYSHGFSQNQAQPIYGQPARGHSKGASSKADLEFSNFGYSYDSKNAPSQGSGSLSGNSRSTPPASPSATPPTPNTLDATDMKLPYSIPGI